MLSLSPQLYSIVTSIDHRIHSDSWSKLMDAEHELEETYMFWFAQEENWLEFQSSGL